ncbi:MAG: tripartite tricarboxylate transporter permease [Candidatus Nanohaloarchaea archaeon]
MIEAAALIGLGVLTGAATGVIPGIHPNTVIFSVLPFYFILNPDFMSFMAFISGLGVSHSLHDFLPALFLKTPEAESALSSLPGVKMVEQGLGRKAFILTLIGGLSSTVIFILSLPLIFTGLKTVYGLLEEGMFFVLVFFLVFILLESESTLHASIVASLSGVLGLLTLNSGIEQQFILMPVFSGLFAVPAVIYSFQRGFEIPEQKQSFRIRLSRLKDGSTGFLAGFLAGIVPGIGAAVSTTFLTPLMEGDKESFLTGLGGVNTSDILISFLALHLIGRPRTGSSVALQSISQVRLPDVMFLTGCSILATGISGIIALKNLDFFLKAVRKIEFRFIGSAAIATVLIAAYFTTGLYGLLVLSTSSFIGTLALLKNCRASSMAILIVPALTYFSGSFI